jgi:hypothetical protein
MRRSAVLRGTFVVCATLLALAGCGSSPEQTTAGRSGSSAGTVDAGTVTQWAENNFIGTTAAHLCNVQSTVYDDTRALAAAYQSPPPYPGLDAAQVAGFQKRLTTDAAFSARLTNQLRAICHPTVQ